LRNEKLNLLKKKIVRNRKETVFPNGIREKAQDPLFSGSNISPAAAVAKNCGPYSPRSSKGNGLSGGIGKRRQTSRTVSHTHVAHVHNGGRIQLRGGDSVDKEGVCETSLSSANTATAATVSSEAREGMTKETFVALTIPTSPESNRRQKQTQHLSISERRFRSLERDLMND